MSADKKYRLPPDLPELADRWQWKALGELIVKERGICYGIVQPGKHDESGVPMVNTGDILNSEPCLNIEFKVSQSLHDKFKRSTLRGGEILLTLVGANFGRVAIAPDKYAGYNCSRAVGVIPVVSDAEYIMYALQSPLCRYYMVNWANTTAQPTFNLGDATNLPIPWAPEKEREEISAMISCLDKKLNLNRQTNQTLEQIAQTIFKSWFVDFDPVKAKIAAKQNGQDPEFAAMCAISGKSEEQLNELGEDALQQLKTTAALFPDALVESELGEVPEGWGVGILDDLCDLNAKSWTKKNAPPEVWYVDLANTKHGVVEEVQCYSWGDAPSRARRIVSDGDTIVGTVRPGNRSFALIGSSENQLTASTGFAVLSPKKREYLEYVNISATSDENIDRLAHLADGGAYPAVRPDVVTQMDITIPSEKIMSVFSGFVKPLFQKRHGNLTEQNNLAALRDALLPKLLSNEFEVDAT
jgi:type I restriction enzyme S subunit